MQCLVLLIAQNRRRQAVKAHHVRWRAILGFDDVGIDYAGLRQQPVRELLLTKSLVVLEALQVLIEHGAARADVGLRKGSEARRLRRLGQLVHLDHPAHCHPRPQVRETALDELLRIEAAMPVRAPADRLGDDNTCCVRSLEDALHVAAAGHLTDEHRGQALGAQLLMHAQEVHLHAADLVAMNDKVGRNGGNEGDELLVGTHAHAQVKVLLPARRRHRPANEVARVVEAKGGVAVLHVILVEQCVEFAQLRSVLHLHGCPLESLRELEGLCGHAIRVRRLDGAPRVLRPQFGLIHPWDGLRVPECMVIALLASLGSLM
mmetsp:Transcript_8497/g.21934  ORF Transcript_8497/g.21934 Transcript_8497/m.21934 type:complete len:319 (+) Transcript_8497:685-1641(+)